MIWDSRHLEALVAIVDLGTLEAAAVRLHLTPSAVSQRLRALEREAGAVLVRRTRPVEPTAAGEPFVRLARQVAALSDAIVAPTGTVVRLAVGADALATWVLPAVAALADRVTLQFHREDQARTLQALRDGTVMAAITSDESRVQGCTVTGLGVMRYLPAASVECHRRWFGDGVTPDALARAPYVDYDEADRLQSAYLGMHGVAGPGPRHRVPASTQFAQAVRLGFGWGMLPEDQASAWLRAGEIVVLDDRWIDVPLFWQQWSLDLAPLSEVADAITAGARTSLRQR